MTVSEDARKMKAYIEEHGWWQGEMRNYASRWPDTPEVCLIGSSIYALGRGEHWHDSPVIDAVCDLIGTQNPAKWNDAPERTKEEVLEMLENVAIKHDSDEYRG